MKKQYAAPCAEVYSVEYASFLSDSGEVGDAVAVDIFGGSFGKSF